MFSGAFMKKLAIAIAAIALIGTPAFAADMAVKARPAAPAPMPAPVYNWTGWYVGLNAGGAWGHSDNSTSTVFNDPGYFDPTSIPAIASAGAQSTDLSGFTGGIQAGYNWQW